MYATDERGLRVVRQAVISMPRKNGKTELIAALALCHLCGPEAELNGQVFCAAADREQAGLLFAAAAAMVRMDEELASILRVIDSRKRIVHYASGSFFQALSKESRTKHGLNPSFVVYDELAQAENRKLYDVLTTSMGARAQPLFVAISVQGDDPMSPMGELVDYGRAIEAGEIDDPTFYMALYEAKNAECSVMDEAAWAEANPALGDFRSLEDVRTAAKKALKSPSFEQTFRLLFLNQRVSTIPAFITRPTWMALERKREEVLLENFPRAQAAAGLDLSSTRDLTAFAIAILVGGRIKLLIKYFIPAFGLKVREEQERQPYTRWVKDGWLIATPGRAVNKRVVLEHMVAAIRKLRFTGTAYDRWRIEDLLAYCGETGLSASILNLQPHGQGFKDMAPAIDAFEDAVIQELLDVEPNPVTRWCLANCVVVRDGAGNRKLDKQKARGRIDGVVAGVMAVHRLQAKGKPKKPRISVFGEQPEAQAA